MHLLRNSVLVLVTLILISSAASAQTACHLLDSSTDIPDGFGAAYNLFSSQKEVISKVHCGPGSKATLAVGDGQSSLFIYKVAYEWTGSNWRELALSGQSRAGDWYIGSAAADLVRSEAQLAQDNFVIAWTCFADGNQWKCGCRDGSCARNYWQLQAFKYAPAPSGEGHSVRAPEPPKSYSLPSGGIRVSNSAELISALAQSSPRDIILENGTYDNGGPFTPKAAHRLWAASLGGAKLTAGIRFQNGTGGEVHGIRFDVTTEAKTFEDSIIRSGGSAHGIVITDSWLEGNGKVTRGVLVRESFDGVQLKRLHIRNFKRDGIRIIGTDDKDAHPPVAITDIDVANIVHPDSTCCNGTAETGIWLGTKGVVERVKVRNADWMCVNTVTWAMNTVWRDLDLDECKVGIYLEHNSAFNTFERFTVGRNVQTGVNFEGGQGRWNIDDLRWNWKAIGPGNTIHNATINAYRVGVNVAPCNAEVTVQNVKFTNQCSAAIWDGARVNFSSCPAPKPGGGHSGDSNVYMDNDYSGIDSSAVPVKVTTFHGISCQ